MTTQTTATILDALRAARETALANFAAAKSDPTALATYKAALASAQADYDREYPVAALTERPAPVPHHTESAEVDGYMIDRGEDN